MGRLKTGKEKKEKMSLSKERELNKKVILGMQEEIFKLNDQKQTLANELTDFINLVGLTKKTLVDKKGTKIEKDIVIKTLGEVVDVYLEGNCENAIQVKKEEDEELKSAVEELKALGSKKEEESDGKSEKK